MLFDFERLYIWKKRRFLLSTVDVMVVLPKEVDIPTMIAYYNEHGRVAFPNFLKYVEWFGGRLANVEEDLPVIDLEAQKDFREAERTWTEKGIDTTKIGIKDFVPIEEEIRHEKTKQFDSR